MRLALTLSKVLGLREAHGAVGPCSRLALQCLGCWWVGSRGLATVVLQQEGTHQ